MVRGIESFREWFREYDDCYAIIGGTACDLLMTEEGLNFRATRDLDMVLIVEATDASFGNRFWEYIVSAGYEHRNKSSGKSQFYRFTNPKSTEFPTMIELFTRRTDLIVLPDNAWLTPLSIDEVVPSLSAILLDNDYYKLVKQGRIKAEGIVVLDALHLIPFKAKAWMNLSDLKSAGEKVDSKHIRKHKNDVFRLTELLNHNQSAPNVPDTVRTDMIEFIEKMEKEDIDLKQLGIHNRTKKDILEELRRIFQ